MVKKIRRGMEHWGHYLLALLCAGVILLSAVWTREQREQENADQAALSDQSQRLVQALQTPEPAALARPAAGAVVRPFSESPAYFPDTGVWLVHPRLDFEAMEGEKVYAMAAGTVLSCDGGVRLDHGDGCESLYRGLQEIRVKPGQRVKAGEILGTAGAPVPFEGPGRVCVTLLQEGMPAEYGSEWF